MVRPIIEEQIAPADAVARKILKSTEASLMSSVTKIGAGGFGDIYKMSLRRPITDQELEGSHWETPVHNVFLLCGIIADTWKSIARKLICVSKPKDMEDYRNEVEAMRTLCNKSHTNMIQYIRHGTIVSDSIYFIDMELCDINLSQYIKGTQNVTGVHGLPIWNKENPDIFLITAIMQQLLSGLAFMHKEGKVHRDLDPRNGKAFSCCSKANL